MSREIRRVVRRLSDNFLSQDKINPSSQENALVTVDPAKATLDLLQAQVADQSAFSGGRRRRKAPGRIWVAHPWDLVF